MSFNLTICLSIISLLTFGSCASVTRNPSSLNSNSQSIELAQKLEGGEIKFHVFRDKKDISVLGYLNIKFKNCEATAATEDLTKKADLETSSYVVCDVEFNSDPIQGTIRATIDGTKRNFNVNFKADSNPDYSLTAKLRVYYKDKTWKGDGELNGWVKTNLSKGTTINAEINESASF